MEHELSMLEEQLIDEYFRAERHIEANLNVISKCTKGYISHKKIRGNDCYYLQWREGAKVKSKYIEKKQLDDIKREIDIRRNREKSVKMLQRDMRRIEKILGKRLINEYRDKI